MLILLVFTFRASLEERNSSTCLVCHEEFVATGTTDIWTHMWDAHGVARYTCSTCSKGFPKSDALTNHIDSVHEKKEFSCSRCESKFVDRTRLNKHYNKVHSRIQCSVCQKIFKCKRNLRRHIVTHY